MPQNRSLRRKSFNVGSHVPQVAVTRAAACTLLLLLTALTALFVFAPRFGVEAASPSTGALAPSVGATLSWAGTATGGAAPNAEADCTEGGNCDTFTLAVSGAGADWAGKRVRVELGWLSPASDFDMYIYKDSLRGPQVNKSTSGPNTGEAADIDPSLTGAGTYLVHVVYFAATAADQYKGTATVVAAEDPQPAPTSTPKPTPQPTPLPTRPVHVGASGNEPVVLAAPDGTVYVSALQHLYRSTDGGATWAKLPGPVFASQLNLASDSSISVDPGGRLYFTFDYPYAGATAVCTSDDRGDNWTCNPAVVPGGTDRMWVHAPTESEAYEVTNEGLYETTFLSSSDRGLTWLPSEFGKGLLEPQSGPLFKKPGSLNVLQVIKDSAGLSFYVYAPASVGEVFSGLRPTGLPNPYALPSGALGSDGTLWVASETANAAGGRQVVVARSADEGLHWTKLPPVPQTAKGTATFSWVSAGRRGHVGVLYYYTPENGDPGSLTKATWSAVWAESYDADTAQPTWTVHTLEESIHAGAVCIAASCTGNARFAGDFIGSYIDAGDDSHLSWMKDAGGQVTIRYQRVPARVACDVPNVEDDDAALSFESAWHLVSDPAASAGHFRADYGQENRRGLTLSFTVPAGRAGAVNYFYAQSPKGGTASVFLDGVQVATVSYKGGTAQNTAKSPAFGFSKQLAGVAPGAHTLRVVPNGDGVSYVDGFCLYNASASAPASGSTAPGATSAGAQSLAPGQGLLLPLAIPAGAQSVSLMSESNAGLGYKLLLVDASGSVLKTASASSSGLAGAEVPLRPGGTYLLKLVNTGLGPLQVWTAATPLVAR